MTQRSLQRHILQRARYWQKQLQLTHWNIKHNFADDELSPGPDLTIRATCNAQWQYLAAVMGWNLRALGDLTPDELDNVIVHELMHIHLDEMCDVSKDEAHEERVVETLARVVMELCR